jgi:hypothetical protein
MSYNIYNILYNSILGYRYRYINQNHTGTGISKPFNSQRFVPPSSAPHCSHVKNKSKHVFADLFFILTNWVLASIMAKGKSNKRKSRLGSWILPSIDVFACSKSDGNKKGERNGHWMVLMYRYGFDVPVPVFWYTVVENVVCCKCRKMLYNIYNML